MLRIAICDDLKSERDMVKGFLRSFLRPYPTSIHWQNTAAAKPWWMITMTVPLILILFFGYFHGRHAGNGGCPLSAAVRSPCVHCVPDHYSGICPGEL